MVAETWESGPSDGELTVTTGVTGPAASMGHRLTIAMTVWHATVQWADGEPSSVELTVDVDSLDVQRGEGGIKGLSAPEKVMARSNALKTFKADTFPHIRFRADDVAATDGGYRLTGTLEIHGTTHDRVVELAVKDLGDAWRMTVEAVVRHSDFGMKPFSMMMGAMRVEDEVTVSFTGEHAKD
jgi:polyisoprenoid-binding protein YceI